MPHKILGPLLVFAFAISILQSVLWTSPETAQADTKFEELRVYQVLDEISSSERTARLVGSGVRSALGVALVTGGALSADAPSRVLLLLSGGVVTIYGIKGFFVPGAIEDFADQYRARSRSDFDDGALYFIRQSARQNRIWDSSLSLVAGAVTITGGAFASSSFISIFSYVSGGLLVGTGVFGLIFPSAPERAIDHLEFERKRPILKPVALAPILSPVATGAALTLEF